MQASRFPYLNSAPCLDPGPLLEAAQRNGTPTDFYGLANSITCPIGFAPGSAFLLVDRPTIEALDKNAAHTIRWVTSDHGISTFPGWYAFAATCINIDGDGLGAYLLELRDVRQVMRMSAINARYNVLKPLPYTLGDGADRIRSKYFQDSLKDGTSLYTWAEIWESIWSHLPSGTLPGLPYAPAGTPKNFAFSGSAWEAAEEFLAAIGCTLALNPLSGALSAVRLSQAQPGLVAAMAAVATRRIFDLKPKQQFNAANKPATWIFFSPQQHPLEDDHTQPGAENEAGAGGGIAGTKEPIWDRTPTTFCPIGGAQNEAEVTARANEHGAELAGKSTVSDERQGVVYGGLVTTILPGSQISAVTWRDYGDGRGLLTSIAQQPITLKRPPRQKLDVEKIVRCRLEEPLEDEGPATATIIAYDFPETRWEGDQCTLALWDSLRMAGGSLPEGAEVFAKFHYDSEKWEILSLPGENLVFFQLYDDKQLGINPTLATILEFDPATNLWVDTGTFINLYDDYPVVGHSKQGMFTGKALIDRGWAKLRERAEEPESPDDYTIIFMSGPVHVIEFTLDADRPSDGSAADVAATVTHAYRYGHEQLFPQTNVDVHFPAGWYKFSKTGAKGMAHYDDRHMRYNVVVCDQLALLLTGLLSGNVCGDASLSSITGVEAATPFPFSQLPTLGNGGELAVLNFHNHAGQAGDFVTVNFLEYVEEYNILDIEKHQLSVVIDQRTVGYGDQCYTQHRKRQVFVEMCEEQEAQWVTVPHCCCDPGSGGTAECFCQNLPDTLTLEIISSECPGVTLGNVTLTKVADHVWEGLSNCVPGPGQESTIPWHLECRNEQQGAQNVIVLELTWGEPTSASDEPRSCDPLEWYPNGMNFPDDPTQWYVVLGNRCGCDPGHRTYIKITG
jgi:hypothetical protein